VKRERVESCDVLFCGEVAHVVVEEDVACFLHELGWYSLDMVSDFISSFTSFLSWAVKILMLALCLHCCGIIQCGMIFLKENIFITTTNKSTQEVQGPKVQNINENLIMNSRKLESCGC